MCEPYRDMLYREHPVSPSRNRMNRNDRAAQFSPFSALSGFEKLVEKGIAEKNAELEDGGITYQDFEE